MSGASVESVPPKKRRQFSAAEKLRLVKAADAALASGERGALEALLRKEGIYSSHLATWRKQFGAHGAAGLEARKPGRKPKLDAKDRQLLAAQKEVAALKRKLKVANALIALQKKAALLPFSWVRVGSGAGDKDRRAAAWRGRSEACASGSRRRGG